MEEAYKEWQQLEEQTGVKLVKYDYNHAYDDDEWWLTMIRSGSSWKNKLELNLSSMILVRLTMMIMIKMMMTIDNDDDYFDGVC